MLFHSLDFALFLPVVFLLYWLVFQRNLKIQNFFLLGASYVFYGWWDSRFLLLIFLSTVVDYFVGLSLQTFRKTRTRRNLLCSSIVVNVGLLAYFKYCNFFIDSFIRAFKSIGMELEPIHLNIILPVGISFYTFQTLSYTIDVFRKKLEPTQDFIAFAAFVAFFPQLVAGPIERASRFLPQFYRSRNFELDIAFKGLRQMLWGLFKKVVIADTCGRFANDLFEHSHMHSGAMLFLAALFFSFQIYCDFSGYSDIAIGTARLFGFELSINFSYPYFSRNVAEFWRRWHISLSTWFRDYVYIPLGGSRVDKLKIFRNVMIVFLVSGFWHGANWTFITWGALHACLFIPLIIAKRNRKYLEVVAADRLIPKGRELLSMLGTFIMVVLSWILFRAETLIEAGKIYKDLFSGLFEAQHYVSAWNLLRGMQVEFVAAFGIFILFEWMARKQEFALSILDRKIAFLPRLILYYFLIIMILWYGGDKQEFIYFQF